MPGEGHGLNPLIVALGSKSWLEIEATRLAFRHFDIIDMDIIGSGAQSGVSEQPEGFDDMLAGARSRALDAFHGTTGANIGIGLESGIVRIGNTRFDTTVAVIVDMQANYHLGFAPGFPIPTWAVEEARQNDLGAVVMKRGAKDKNPTTYFSAGELDPKETLAWAVKCALASYLNPKLYQPH